MVAGASRNLKLLDSRTLKVNTQESVVRNEQQFWSDFRFFIYFKVWRKDGAHADVIREISWSPFCPDWVATAGDDSCIRVWDIRYKDGPVRTLRMHKNGVGTVCGILKETGN